MKTQLPPLNSLRAFNAVVKHMSFQKAAQELFVTPAALSYQVKQLETYMGVSLFKRLNRAIELTEQGRLIAPGIEQSFELIRHTVAQGMKLKSNDVLVISAGPAFTSKWLAPRLYRFIAKYPHIDARISATAQLCNLQEGDVDIAVRFGAGNYAHADSVKLFDDYVVPLCSPQLLAQMGELNIKALLCQTLIYDDTHLGHHFTISSWPDWFRSMGVDQFKPRKKGLHFNVADHAINAAIASAGIVLGRESLAQGDIESGSLVALFDHKIKLDYAFYALSLPERANEPNIKAFTRWLVEESQGEFDMSTPGTLV